MAERAAIYRRQDATEEAGGVRNGRCPKFGLKCSDAAAVHQGTVGNWQTMDTQTVQCGGFESHRGHYETMWMFTVCTKAHTRSD